MPRLPLLTESVRPWSLSRALLPAALLAAACGGSADPGGTGGTGGDAGGAGGAGGGAGGMVPDQGPPAGACVYENPFSKAAECKQYPAAAWSLAEAQSDCQSAILGAPGVFTEGGACSFPSELGACIVETEGAPYKLVSEGSDAAECEGAKTGCEVFAGGTFYAGEVCGGGGGGGSGGGSAAAVFVQPYQVCKDPLPGEAPGNGPNGQVCTWTIISGSTEENRRYDDYASCADVLTQRPYYAVGANGETPPNDPRLSDAAYMAEVEWARKQVESSACVCCHSTASAPNGATSDWYIESPGIWLDSLGDGGLAMMAGLAASDALGAFPAEENNGFDRTTLGVPTNDIPRMQALLLAEWERRGFTPEQGADFPPFGGPLVDQQLYEPSACPDGIGVSAEGTVSWSGGAARYVYVLAPDSANPGVPPNLDEPVGTLWFTDVPSASPAFDSGISYGEVSGERRQRIPETGQPSPLVSGDTYYLYALRDIAVPITRCLFVAP
jgi:hypothetical protein